MRLKFASLFTGLLMVVAVMFGTAPAPGWAAVDRLIFASAGFHESNRYWTIARPDHLQFEPFWETLVGIDPKTAGYIPALATKWEISPDYKEWTFHLRKGVQFHNGYGEFTCQDVPHNHSLLLRKDSTATLAPFWRTVESVKCVDKYTVVFRFKAPTMPTSMFAFSRSGDLRMSSKAQWDKEGIEGLDKQPAGTGPFQYVGRKTGLNILFKRADKHWSDNKVDYEELEFRIAREEATRLALLLSGDVHIADLPRELHKDALAKGLKRFSSSMATDWVSVYMGGQWYITGDKAFDPKAPFTNKKVREALNISINRKELMATVFAGRAELAYLSLWVPTSEGWNPKWESRFNELYAYNPEKAKQLLKEAGYGPDNPLKFDFWAFTEPGESEGPAIADALAIYFRNVGVIADVQMHDWSKIRTTYRKKLSKDFMWPNIIGWRPSDQGVRNFYSSKGNNHHYEDDFLEKTFGAVQKSTDAEERNRLMMAIGDHLQEEYADIPLFWFRNEVFADSKVVASWVYPGPAAGRSSHFEGIKLVK
ncbi:MAG: ABC transporter substrate-binding protein [Betaproteobacteria bacterium]|nr:ABC transporter substrate-binding protein [Betaproteobacteria bacterium]MDH3437097.1 ABC transporter substrate-binding protein [Betaproteobacteria bacterium]